MQWADPEGTTRVFKNFVTQGTPRQVNLFVDQVSELVNERKLQNQHRECCKLHGSQRPGSVLYNKSTLS